MKNELSTTYMDDTLVRMATSGQSNTCVRSIIKANLEVYRAWQKHNLQGGIHVPVLKPLGKVPQYLYLKTICSRGIHHG